MTKHSMKIMPLDGNSVLCLMRSTAYAQALAESVNIEWKSNSHGSSWWDMLPDLHTVTKVWGNIDAGTAQLNMAKGKELLQRTGWYLEKHLHNFDRALGEGPVAVQLFLNQLQAMRDRRIADVHAALRDVHDVNRQIFNDLSEAMRTTAFIAASATLSLTVIGVCVSGCALALGTSAALGSAGAATGAAAWGATAGAAGWVGTGYGIAGALIKSWNEVPEASAIVINPTVDAVGGEFLKWNDWADKGLDLLQSKAGNNVDLHQRAANFLNGAIQRRAQILMSTVAGPAQQAAQNNLDRFTAANLKAHTAIGQARGAAAGIGVLRGFLCVYVAYKDIQGALDQYEETKKLADQSWGG